MKRFLGFLTALSVLSAAAVAATSPKFESREDFAGLFTRVTIIADVNNDGNPDLVAVLGGVLTILLGDGKGDFRSAPSQDVAAAFSNNIVPVDLNGDGNIDLILDSGEGNSGGITASLGRGNGTFEVGVYYSILSNNGLGGIAVGDFNGDGKVDVVAAADNGIWFLAGNGDGTFGTPVMEAPLEIGSTGAAAADLNGDGKLDFVVTLGAAGFDSTGKGFQVYYGNGDGTFQSPIVFTQPQRSGRVVAGPLRRGGPPAIVVMDVDTSDAWIFPNDGKGNFSTPHFASLPGASDVVMGDMDNDGYTDLISALGYVAYGSAGGYFPTTVSYPVLAPGSSQYTVAVGDLLNSGKLDIVTDSNYAISVVFNEGKRKFQEGNWTPVTGGGYCGASGDFNGDGLQDLAMNDSSGVVILLGSGSTAHPLTVGTTLPLTNAGCPVVGDVNGDGIEDLVVSAPSGVVTFLGHGDGTFTQTSVTLTSAEGALVLGDFNRDGKLDFATSANLLAYGNGDGTFQAPVGVAAGVPAGTFSDIAVGDLNNDGWPDISLSSGASGTNVYSMMNNQHGGFSYVDSGWGAEAAQVLLADMNGDGFLDMVLRGIGGTGAQIFWGNGSGQFTSGLALLGPGLGSGVNLVADFNGDGIPDMALLGDNTVSFYPGLGSGTFGSEVGFGAGPSPSSIIPMNILRPTKPGFSDLAFPDPSGGVTVIYNVTR